MKPLTDGDLADLCIRSYVAGRSLGHIQFLSLWHGDALVVAFRGSDDPVDWLYNARILVGESLRLGVRMHAGVAGLWDGTGAEFAAWLSARRPKALVLAGHSLGGALAAAAAREVHELYPDTPIRLVTFGMPRVFLGGWPVTGTHYRHGLDPIPRLPLSTLLHPYRPLEKVVHLDRPGHLSALASIVAGIATFKPTDPWTEIPGIGDHAMEKYAAAVRRHEAKGVAA